MAELNFEKWCLINKLDPKANSSRKAFKQYVSAVRIQKFIRCISKSVSAEEETAASECL